MEVLSTAGSVAGDARSRARGLAVAALLPRDALPQALRAVHTDGTVAAFSRLDEIRSWMRERPVGLLLVDPSILSSSADGDGWMRTMSHGWQTVLYSCGGATNGAALLDCEARWSLPVIVSRTDDAVFRAESCVEESQEVCQSAELLTALANRLRNLPPHVVIHLVEVFAAYRPPSSLKAFAARCGVSERHARRLLRSVGIRSSHRLFASVRVARAYRDVVQRGRSLTETARCRGFGSRRTLRREWEDATGTTPEWLLALPADRGLTEHLAARLVETADAFEPVMSAKGPPMSDYGTFRSPPAASM